jgi:P-type Ca2+ transporter type 2C
MVSPVIGQKSTQHDRVDEASSRNENPVAGLSEPNAIANLKRDGYNELPSAQARSLLSIAWHSIQDPIFLLLVGGGIIYWILGDLQEALILLGFVVFLTAISLYQEGKTEHALEALRDLSSPRALVIRDGQRKRIAGREVVRDDILMLAEGDRVPADAIILSCTNLSTNESLLTGEFYQFIKLPLWVTSKWHVLGAMNYRLYFLERWWYRDRESSRCDRSAPRRRWAKLATLYKKCSQK